jgi:cadherin 5 type 2 (VE-cadherin)
MLVLYLSMFCGELLWFVSLPGRAYNISVQTLSEDEISAPTTAQYRTVPLRPLNVTFDKNSITSSSFKVHWDPPKGIR